jgi:predicted nucleic acid-binding Zn ribbon protein
VRRTRSQPEPVGPLVGRVLDDLGASEITRVLRVVEGWEEAVGPEIAHRCRPTALRGRVLEVSVESSVWCQQLQLRIPEMLAGLREAFGEEAPAELWLRVESPGGR